MILGADIIYHRTDFDALVKTIGFFLSDGEAEKDHNKRPPQTTVIAKEDDSNRLWNVTNENALVVITMQERHYGALDGLVQMMYSRLGMSVRLIDVPLMLSKNSDSEGDQDNCSSWIGANHHMVIFYHPQTSLDLSLLGPEMPKGQHQEEDDASLLLSLTV